MKYACKADAIYQNRFHHEQPAAARQHVRRNMELWGDRKIM